MNNQIESHPWQPFIPEDAQIIFLGTFPPKPSKWSMEFYYPNKINDFWRIMGIVFHNDKNYLYNTNNNRFDIIKIKEFLQYRKIALGDVALEAVRLKDNAADKHLKIITPLPLLEIANRTTSLKTIASTGEKAAQVVSEITSTPIPHLGEFTKCDFTTNRTINIYRMPSTSRAYPLALDKKADFYRNMLAEVGIL